MWLFLIIIRIIEYQFSQLIYPRDYSVLINLRNISWRQNEAVDIVFANT